MINDKIIEKCLRGVYVIVLTMCIIFRGIRMLIKLTNKILIHRSSIEI